MSLEILQGFTSSSLIETQRSRLLLLIGPKWQYPIGSFVTLHILLTIVRKRALSAPWAMLCGTWETAVMVEADVQIALLC